MKKKLLAALLTVTAMVASMPTTAFAAPETVNPTSQKDFEVTATANVSHDDLAALGMNVVVSIPAEVALSLDDSKNFAGSDTIFAYGIMDTDNTLSVTIDNTNEAYGDVKYRTAGGEETEDAGNFFSTVEETLSKESFSAGETKDNYLANRDSEAMTNLSTLNVSIKGLIPTSGTGAYFTNVPLKIAIQ